MDCTTCNKPVELNEKFISGFTPDLDYFVKHATCAGVRDPKKIKTMTPLRVESIATYHQNKAKLAKV